MSVMKERGTLSLDIRYQRRNRTSFMEVELEPFLRCFDVQS